MLFAATGTGALVLVTAGWLHVLPSGEKWCVALALGLGGIGWLAFWPGIIGLLTPSIVLAGIVLLLPANILLLPGDREYSQVSLLENTSKNIEWGSVAVSLAVVGTAMFVLDFVEALAPPIEADTLAYHFDLPDTFADEEHISFVPRVLTGAVPLLVHMTYTVASVIGKFSWLDAERLMMFWVFFTGWGGAVMLFFLARRWISPAWALSLALIYQTMPTFIYGAGTGLVEARLGLFVIAAVIFIIAIHHHSDNRGTVALLGIAVGFYMASKYTGLLFAVAFGVTLLVMTFRLSAGFFLASKYMCIFLVAALLAGGQWYVWNFLHTGDPVFPMLYRWLGDEGSPYWTFAHDAYFRTYMASKSALIGTFFEKLIFPWSATFTPAREIDSGRVGLGPFLIIVLPLSIYAAWVKRKRVFSSEALPAVVALLLYYLIWLQFGGIPKVRHLSPVVGPIALLLSVVTLKVKAFYWPVAFAVTVTLCLQAGAQVIYTKSLVQRIIMGESRDQYLMRAIGDEYSVIKWINDNAKEIPHLLISDRHFNYQIKTKTTFLLPHTTAIIDLREGFVSADKLWEGICKLGVSHVLNSREDGSIKLTMAGQYLVLEKRGVMVLLKTFKSKQISSRTLKVSSDDYTIRSIWRVERSLCSQL